MFSFVKILVLAFIILAVCYGFKYVNRIQKHYKKRHETARRQDAIRDASDMIKCPQCAAFVVANGATDCGKSICPY